MKKDNKLYSIFIIAIIIDFTIFGYLIYSNYQLQQKVSNLEKEIPKIEDRLSQQNIQFEDVNEKVSNMIEKEKTKQYYENLTQEEKSKHPTWVEDDYYFDNSSIEGSSITGYVDMYTGKVIGGFYGGV